MKTEYSELELLVMKDMMENGYDPLNPEEVKEYWRLRLE